MTGIRVTEVLRSCIEKDEYCIVEWSRVDQSTLSIKLESAKWCLVFNCGITFQGGRHVDHVADAIVKQLIDVIKKKNKGGMAVKPFQVKNHMWIFINCLIVNPTFDSQTKETMTLQAKNFGSKCALSEKFITSVSFTHLHLNTSK